MANATHVGVFVSVLAYKSLERGRLQVKKIQLLKKNPK